MTSRFSPLLKALSPALMVKVVTTFDKMTLLIIGLSWSVTVAVMIFAIYAVNMSSHAKMDAEAAQATEPNLPVITQSGVGGKELSTMIDRMKDHFPDLNIVWQNNTLTIGGTNGGVYHQWLTAIGQIDTLYPQFHWNLQTMCIGKGCGGQYLMMVELNGRKITVEMPQPAN